MPRPLGLENYDPYYEEAEQFIWDAHVLISRIVDAGMTTIDAELEKELKELEELRSKRGVNLQRLEDERVDALSMSDDQSRFLRNSAMVMLTSRLYLTLRRMTQRGYFTERNPAGYSGKSEWHRLWKEYRERFGIEFSNDLVGFIEPMVLARNQIIHEGGDATLIREDGTWDDTFTQKYPEYVHGAGIGAEVSVSTEQLQENIEKSIAVVKWAAKSMADAETRVETSNS